MISVRYIVDDAQAAAAFYGERLGFDLQAQPAPSFAILSRGELRLLLSEPTGPGGAAQPMPDGRRPEPGGWNRFQIEVEDVAAQADELRRAGVTLRSDVVRGRGGAQVLVEDPSGNPVELFEPAR
jgi:catechol 2,3-dioxygenase-like lactoylglutathione lyase family enzyme